MEYWNFSKLDYSPSSDSLLYVITSDNSIVLGLASNDIIAIVGIFIALLALFISLRQNSIARKHNVLSVRPILETMSTNNGGENLDPEKGFTIELVNNGLGPAEIIDFSLFINDKKVYGDGEIASLNGGNDVRAVIQHYLKVSCTDIEVDVIGNKTCLLPGDKRTIISIKLKTSHRELATLKGEIKFTAHYQDLYGNKMPVLD